MSLNVSSNGAMDFEMVPPGLYIARCYRLIDLGTQTSTNSYGTTSKKKIMISWELLDDPRMEDGRPFSVHKNYTASLNDKANLRADLESWRNRKFTDIELESFDLTSILGAYCQIQVVHSEDGKFANVQSIVTFKGTNRPEPVNPDLAFDIDNPDMQVFDALSDTVKAKITEAPEWNAVGKSGVDLPPVNPDVVIEDIEGEINLDDIPF